MEYVQRIVGFVNGECPYGNMSSLCLLDYEPDRHCSTDTNEFLIILKPEIFQSSNLETLLIDVLDRLDRESVTIVGMKIISGEYSLKKSFYRTQYRILNRGARLGGHVLKGYGSQYLTNLEMGDIVGAYPFLERHPEITASELEKLAHELGPEKISNGTYLTVLNWNNGVHYILNAFHPHQLDHLNRADNYSLLLAVRTGSSMEHIAQQTIGYYNISKAHVGSLRKMIFADQERYGLDNISVLRNGFHNSPSPLEGMYSIMNAFNVHEYSQVSLGRLLIKRGIGNDTLDQCRVNPPCAIDGSIVSPLFELLEGKNTDHVVGQILRKHEYSAT